MSIAVLIGNVVLAGLVIIAGIQLVDGLKEVTKYKRLNVSNDDDGEIYLSLKDHSARIVFLLVRHTLLIAGCITVLIYLN